LLVVPRGTSPAAADGRTPKLIVLLVVDQLRADYLDRFGHQWTGGLRRLMTDGAWFRQAEYPYADTVTCVGHSSISTGAMPSQHGMILNAWWDRGTQKLVACMDDESATTISYGKPVTTVGESLARLRLPTLADELRAQLTPASRVVSFSLKARSAAPLAGRRPDAIAWFDDSGSWVTSTAFSTGPVREIADYVARHPVDADFTRAWDRALPKTAYLFEESPTTFPYPMAAGSPAPDRGFYARWQSSPFADEYLARMAIDVARQRRIGTTTSTDLLAVSFSTLDRVGHEYGPNSHEVQDVLIRLDRTLAEFFAGVNQLVGAGNYVVVLTSDHGVAPLPERTKQLGIDAGRVDQVALSNAVRAALVKSFGPGNYISRFVDGEVYLQPGVFAKLRQEPAALEMVRAAAHGIAGIQDVYTSDELEGGRSTDSALMRRYALGHVPVRSGDLTLVPRPYWLIRATGTAHGSGYGYDTHVPILLMGKGIVPGEYLSAATPLDIAPTLAFLANITLSHAQGRVLAEALAPLPAPASAGPAAIR
jgi:predicted AlkP superfamily pyrophosphatase or phosphodiesterase